MAVEPGRRGSQGTAAIGVGDALRVAARRTDRDCDRGAGLAISYDLAGKELWRMSGMSGAPIPMPFAYDGCCT